MKEDQYTLKAREIVCKVWSSDSSVLLDEEHTRRMLWRKHDTLVNGIANALREAAQSIHTSSGINEPQNSNSYPIRYKTCEHSGAEVPKPQMRIEDIPEEGSEPNYRDVEAPKNILARMPSETDFYKWYHGYETENTPCEPIPRSIYNWFKQKMMGEV